jgi:bacteriocin-like protein
VNDKNDKTAKKSERLKKTLTVEDLAQVIGGVADTEEGTLKVGGETKYTQRESRFPPVVIGGGILIGGE